MHKKIGTSTSGTFLKKKTGLTGGSHSWASRASEPIKKLKSDSFHRGRLRALGLHVCFQSNFNTQRHHENDLCG